MLPIQNFKKFALKSRLDLNLMGKKLRKTKISFKKTFNTALPIIIFTSASQIFGGAAAVQLL